MRVHKGKSNRIRTTPKGIRAPDRLWELLEAAGKVEGLHTPNDAAVRAFEEFVDRVLPDTRRAA